MTEENGMGFSAPTESDTHSTAKSKKRKSSFKEAKETVVGVPTEVETGEEAVEYEPPAPSAPTPPSPVAAPAPAEPWKPLIRPMKKSEGSQGPNRSEMRRTL